MMTIEYIKQEAAKSDWHAWKVSMDKWFEALYATEKELKEMYMENYFNNVYCGLCERHLSKRNCPLKPNDKTGCTDTYYAAHSAIRAFHEGRGSSYAAKAAIFAMVKELERVEPKKEEPKPEYYEKQIGLIRVSQTKNKDYPVRLSILTDCREGEPIEVQGDLLTSGSIPGFTMNGVLTEQLIQALRDCLKASKEQI